MCLYPLLAKWWSNFSTWSHCNGMSCLVWGNVDATEIIFSLSLWTFWSSCLKGCPARVLSTTNLSSTIWDEKALPSKLSRILFMASHGSPVTLSAWVPTKMTGGWAKPWGSTALWVGFRKEWTKSIHFMRWSRLDSPLVAVLTPGFLVCFAQLSALCNKSLLKSDTSRYTASRDIKMGCKAWYRDWPAKSQITGHIWSAPTEWLSCWSIRSTKVMISCDRWRKGSGSLANTSSWRTGEVGSPRIFFSPADKKKHLKSNLSQTTPSTSTWWYTNFNCTR